MKDLKARALYAAEQRHQRALTENVIAAERAIKRILGELPGPIVHAKHPYINWGDYRLEYQPHNKEVHIYKPNDRHAMGRTIQTLADLGEYLQIWEPETESTEQPL